MATEKRLIERIADRLKDAYPQADRNNLCPAIYYDDFAEIVDDVLSEFEEAVDAVEVVHGRWVMPTIINGRNFKIPHCSVCNEVPCGVSENTKYCAICGARMDLENTKNG